MKYLIAHFVLLFCIYSLANAQLSDDFSDGNFSVNPSWSGDDSKYEINANLQLQLSAPAESSHAYLSTSSTAIADAQWQFYLEISENPSSSNFCRIYLVADRPDLAADLHGYFVEIGGSQDEVSLYRQDGNGDTKLIDGANDRVDTKPVRIAVQVSRDLAGNWTLKSKPAGETDFITEGTAFDDTYTESQFFGIYCQYTSTRSSAFSFDDFRVSGTSVPDTSPPLIIDMRVKDATSINLVFNEALKEEKATQPYHYSLENRQPSQVIYVDDTVKLKFTDPMPNGIFQSLQVTGLSDLSDNTMADTSISVVYFEPVPPAWQSIIVNEFLADPTPSQGTLPDDSNAEFIELYNRDNHPYLLKDWTVNGEALPEFILLPGAYVILCPKDFNNAFRAFGDVINPESWPGLTNSGSTIALKSPDGKAIDTYTYTNNEVGAGISTERIYHTPPCGIASNYQLSVASQGATPGAVNSIFSDAQDTQPPRLQSIEAISYDSLIVTFDEKVYSTADWKDQITINGTIYPDEVRYHASDSSGLLLYFSDPLPGNMMHRFVFDHVQDCEGNVNPSLETSFYLDLDPPAIQEIIILDTASIEVRFSEKLETGSAERESNYHLLPFDTKPRKSLLNEDSTSVHLAFSQGLQHHNNLQLEVSGLSDRYDNVIAANSPRQFSFAYRNDIDSLVVINAYQLDVYLHQTPGNASLLAAHFEVDRSVGLPFKVRADQDNPRKIQLFFERAFTENRDHELTIRGLFDQNGQRIATPISRFIYDTEGPRIEEVKAISARELQLHMSEDFQMANDKNLMLFLNGDAVQPASYQTEGKHLMLQLSEPLVQEQHYRMGIDGLLDLQGNFSDPEQDYRYYYDQLAPRLDSAYFYSPHQIMLVFHEPILKPAATTEEIIRLITPANREIKLDLFKLNDRKAILSFTSLERVQTTVFQIDKLSDLNHNMMIKPIEVRLENQVPKIGYVSALSDHALALQLTLPDPGVSANDFWLDGLYRPDSLRWLSDDRLQLFFDHSFREHIRYALSFRNQKLFFVYQDFVESVVQSGPSTLHVRWETDLEPGTAEDAENYLLSGSTPPVVASYIADERLLQLIFAQPFEDHRLHEIQFSSLTDADGFRIPDSHYYFGQTATPGLHELIITEIMADPEPVMGLPQTEYVEVFNNTDRPLQLEGVIFRDANQSSTLPSYWLMPGDYLILCDEDDYPEMVGFGNTLGLRTFPNLNAEADRLKLIAPDGYTVLHQLSYDRSWYNDEHKSSGGWSLEMVDTRYPCRERENWTASVHNAGGTPGNKNAVEAFNPDTQPPVLQCVVAENDELIRVVFNEKLSATALPDMKFRLNETPLYDVELQADQQTLNLSLSTPLQTGKPYTLEASYIADCSANVGIDSQLFTFYLPERHHEGDILFSEILFHPRTGGVDFVELYNHSSRHISLKNWKLAVEKSDGLHTYIISEEAWVMAPASYLALCEDTSLLLADYPATHQKGILSEMRDFPNLLADGGTVMLLDAENNIMQKIPYSPDWHHPLLQEKRGVSLERISWNGTEDVPQSWQSAASTAGFATPGYQNSQWMAQQPTAKMLHADPPVFYPDQSGYLDYTRIHLASLGPGAIGNLKIFDAKGRMVKILAQNTSLAEDQVFIWDGTDDQHRRAKDGYYIIWAETFDTKGRVRISKTKVAVGSRY